MDNSDIFRSAVAALERGSPVGLVTVTAALGSTPGKVGYKMLVCADASVVGTVGGGLAEARMIDEAAKMLRSPGVRWIRFRLDQTLDDALGICGGSVQFLIETFDATALPLFQEILAATCHDVRGALISWVSADSLPRKACVAQDAAADTLERLGLTPALSQQIAVAAARATADHTAGVMVDAGDMQVFIEPLSMPPTVVLCGAGHLAYHVARYARSLHFRVVVIDERPEYANRKRFPDADEVVVADFRQVFDSIRVDADSYIVIVTRGHACDEIVLEQAVRTNARYIGMIGSRQKTRTVLRNLRANGVSQELLDRVYSPIGLSIGAITAEEIALSIVGELVKVRRAGESAPIGHMKLSAHASGS